MVAIKCGFACSAGRSPFLDGNHESATHTLNIINNGCNNYRFKCKFNRNGPSPKVKSIYSKCGIGPARHGGGLGATIRLTSHATCFAGAVG